MCFTIDECATHLDSGYRKARKNHRCQSCEGDIWPRERYEFFKGVWEGGVFESKLCKSCMILSDKIYAIEIAEGCGPYESRPPWDDISSHAYNSDLIQWRTAQQKRWDSR